MLLHGYMSQKESFFYQTESLCKGFKVTAPDFAGFGKSQAPSTAFSVSDYAEWTYTLCKKLKVKNPHVVAHSFGARVAIKLLSSFNFSAKKIVLVGGAGVVKLRSSQYIRRVNAYKRIKKIFPKFAERHFGSEEYKTLSPIMRESYKKIVNEDLQEEAKKISNETLLIYGEGDTVTPYLEEGLIFKGCIKNSRLLKMQGTHFCFCEYPEVFNNLILQFLNDNLTE